MPPPASQMVKPWPLWSRPALAFEFPLAHRQPADLAAPVDERRVEQPALLQVLDQRRGRLVGALADRRQRRADVVVRVPRLAAEEELHEPHAALDQPAGDQAAGAVLARSRPGRGRTCFRMCSGSRETSSASLAAVCMRGGQLVAGDARLPGRPRRGALPGAGGSARRGGRGSAAGRRRAACGRRVEVEDARLLRAEHRALIERRHEPARPVVRRRRPGGRRDRTAPCTPAGSAASLPRP